MDIGEFEALIQAHETRLHDYLEYLGAGRDNSTEDLLQETLLAAFKSANPPASPDPRTQSAWLRGIARNLYLAHCHRVRTGKVRADSVTLEHAEATWNTEYLREDNGAECLEALRNCLRQLGPRQGQVIQLYYEQNMSRKELASHFEMTEDGIKTLLRRTRAGLADCVKRRLTGKAASVKAD